MILKRIKTLKGYLNSTKENQRYRVSINISLCKSHVGTHKIHSDVSMGNTVFEICSQCKITQQILSWVALHKEDSLAWIHSGWFLDAFKKDKCHFVHLTPPVIDVLLLKYIGCVPAEGTHLPGGWISTSQAVIRLTHGGQGGFTNRNKTVTSFARVLENVNRQLNAQ